MPLMPSRVPSGETRARTRKRSLGSPRALARTSARHVSPTMDATPFGGESTHATSVASRPVRASARTTPALRSPAAPSSVEANASAPAKAIANPTGRHANRRSGTRTDAKNDAADLDEIGTDEPELSP